MKGEQFWSVAIEAGSVQAAIWNIVDGVARVETVSTVAGWKGDEELVSAADTALSSAVAELADDINEPSRTVFGLSPSWVVDGQIKKEYLEKIRLICNKLSLEPAGFVVLPEAIAYFKKPAENAPISAVIVGTNQESVDISVFRLGSLTGNVTVARSVSIVDDVVEGLSRFSLAEPLPSRFLIYDGKENELDDAKQNLIKADWMDFKEKIKFLHTPQVEIMTPKEKMIAISLAGAAEIANVTAVNLKENEGHDNLREVHEETMSGAELGFVESDVATLQNPNKPERKISLPIFKLPKINLETDNKLSVILIVLMIVIGVLFSAWWFLPSASVTIFIAPKKVEVKKTLKFDQKATSVDLAKGIVPAHLLSSIQSGEKTKSATGTKTVGQAAKGQIDIRNGTGNIINLPVNTILTGANNLKFSLDNSASVSAAISPANPGTVTTSVTALNVGGQYNLAKGETFQVGDLSKSQVDAIADGDFSGGSSQEVTAVSKDDASALLTDLTRELTDEGKSDLSGNISENQIIVDSELTATSSSKVYDHAIGEEATSLKLNLKENISALVVSKDDLFNLARDGVAGELPTGFAVRSDQIEYIFAKNGEVTMRVNLLPQIKTDDIANKISGKTPSTAKNILANIPGFTKAEIHLKPSLPGFLQTLPHIAKKITVELSSSSSE